jgi:glycerol uptake facilitator-like aquaporin
VLIKKLLAEFIGTCFLVMVVVGSGIMAENLTSNEF